MDILTYDGFEFYLPGFGNGPLFIATSRIMNVSSGPSGCWRNYFEVNLRSDLPCHFQASLPVFTARKIPPSNNSSTSGVFFSTEGISFILVHEISGSSSEASQVFCICVIDP